MSIGEEYQLPTTSDTIQNIKIIIGIILVIIGVAICIWVFIGVYRIMTNPQEMEAFRKIIPDNQKFRELDMGEEKVVLPEGLYNFLSYIAVIFMLFIAAIVGTALLGSGVSLLQPNWTRLELRLNKRFMKIENKLDEVKDIARK